MDKNWSFASEKLWKLPDICWRIMIKTHEDLEIFPHIGLSHTLSPRGECAWYTEAEEKAKEAVCFLPASSIGNFQH